MKELTEKQKRTARLAVNALQRLQSEGVEILAIDGGGGNSGLTFWCPTDDERWDAYNLVSTEEFREKSYYPPASIGLRIDSIVP